jgi:hypothetical protein
VIRRCQFSEPFARVAIELGVVAFGPDPIEIHAEGVRGRVETHGAVPAVVVPGDADVEMMRHEWDAWRLVRADESFILGQSVATSSVSFCEASVLSLSKVISGLHHFFVLVRSESAQPARTHS